MTTDCSKMDQMLKSLKDKSAAINEKTEQFQKEIKSIMNEMIQSNLNNEQISKYNSKLDALFAGYSSSINKLETEHLIKFEQCIKNPTHNPITSSNNAKTHSHSYKCDKCDISYTAKSSLSRHNRKNHSTNSNNKLSTDSDESTESLYACIHCDESHETYSSLYYLRKHIRKNHSATNINNSDEFTVSHSDDSTTIDTNKLKCNICNKTFKNAAGLGSHMAAHKRKSMESDTETDDNDSDTDSDDDDDIADDRPYKCNVCTKDFAEIRYLRQHMLKVHKLNPWECNECDESFKLKRDLLAHKKSVHNGNDENKDHNHNEAISYNANNDNVGELIGDDDDDNDNELMLYCVCRQPYDAGRSMISCLHCIEWYHYECIGLSEEQNVTEYICIPCQRKSQ